MNVLKLSLNSNCIMGCCNTTSWKYNKEELLAAIRNNNIEKIIIFTPCLNSDRSKIEELVNLINNNFDNIKVIVRTIFYRVSIIDIIELTYNNFCFIEFIINEKTNFFENQLTLKEYTKKRCISNNNNISITNMIYSNDINYIKEFSDNKILTNSENKTDIIRLNTDLSIEEIKECFKYQNKVYVEFDKSDNIIELCYYSCSNINIYKNVIVIYIGR